MLDDVLKAETGCWLVLNQRFKNFTVSALLPIGTLEGLDLPSLQDAVLNFEACHCALSSLRVDFVGELHINQAAKHATCIFDQLQLRNLPKNFAYTPNHAFRVGEGKVEDLDSSVHCKVGVILAFYDIALAEGLLYDACRGSLFFVDVLRYEVRVTTL